MAMLDHTEQEQLSELKAWWEQYGNIVTGIATLAAAVAVGWQGWNWYQGRQAAGAAGLYAVVASAQEAGSVPGVREAASKVIDQYGGTAYAEMAALTAAHAELGANSPKNAEAQLSWLVEHGRDPALQAVARLRLAAVQLDQKAYDAALKTVSVTPPDTFAARFADARGDVLAAQGKPAEARKAYDEALSALNAAATRDGLREIVQFKIDTLNGGK